MKKKIICIIAVLLTVCSVTAPTRQSLETFKLSWFSPNSPGAESVLFGVDFDYDDLHNELS